MWRGGSHGGERGGRVGGEMCVSHIWCTHDAITWLLRWTQYVKGTELSSESRIKFKGVRWGGSTGRGGEGRNERARIVYFEDLPAEF